MVARTCYRIKTSGRIVETRDTELAADASRRGDTVTAVTESGA